MVRRPNTTHTLIQTRHWLLGSLQLVPAGLLEDRGLLHDVTGLEVSHADSLLLAIDVVALDDGVLGRSWRDADFDLGVFTGKSSEILGQEGPMVLFLSSAPEFRKPIVVPERVNRSLTAYPGSFRQSCSSENQGACTAR